MTRLSQKEQNNTRISHEHQENEDQLTFEEHLDEINDAGRDGDLKSALALAKKKLKQSVKAEKNLRARLARTEEEYQDRISGLERDLEDLRKTSKEELQSVKKLYDALHGEHSELVLKASLIAEGVDPDRLDQAMRLIDDSRYFTETEGRRDYNFDAFKEDNDNIFLDKPINPFELHDDESTGTRQSNSEELEAAIERVLARSQKQNSRRDGSTTLEESDHEDLDDTEVDDTNESKPFPRMRGTSQSESNVTVTKRLVTARYPRPNLPTKE